MREHVTEGPATQEAIEAHEMELARTLRLRMYQHWRALADSTSTIAIAARLGR